MNNIKLERNQLIKALMKGLNIEVNIFSSQSVAEEIEQIQEHQFMDFYKSAMSENAYGNGLLVIMRTVEKFNPNVEDDLITKRAKDMISAVETMNTLLFDECHKTGAIFEDYVREYEFTNISNESKVILNAVKPFCDLKQLVISIRQYKTSVDALNAFKSAIVVSERNGSLEISTNVRKLLK